MALTAAEANHINNLSNICKVLLDQYGPMAQANTLWAGSPNYDTTITQADLDTVASFSGLTTTTLGDAEFAVATILTTITNALPSLTEVANLP